MNWKFWKKKEREKGPIQPAGEEAGASSNIVGHLVAVNPDADTKTKRSLARITRLNQAITELEATGDTTSAVYVGYKTELRRRSLELELIGLKEKKKG